MDPFSKPHRITPPPGSSGLTRLQLHMMQQRITQRMLSEACHIPAPTISQYSLGHRNISKSHLPLLSIALSVPPHLLTGYATTAEVLVIPGEWSETNPFYYRRRFSTRPPYMDTADPIKPHVYPHNAKVKRYTICH